MQYETLCELHVSHISCEEYSARYAFQSPSQSIGNVKIGGRFLPHSDHLKTYFALPQLRSISLYVL